jgi:hypothetical protein
MDGRDPLLKARAPTKGVKLTAVRIAPGTEPPLPPVAPTPSSTLGLHLELIDPCSRFSSTTGTPLCRALVSAAPPRAGVWSTAVATVGLDPPSEFHAPAVLAADRRFKPPL